MMEESKRTVINWSLPVQIKANHTKRKKGQGLDEIS